MSLMPVDPTIRTKALPALTGGLSSFPAKDNECPIYNNVDVNRDGWLTTRTGTVLAHDLNALGSNQVTGIANLGINDGRLYIVVAKQGTTFYFHVPSTNWVPGLYANFGTFTVPYDGGTSRTNFTSAFITGTPGAVPPAGEGEHEPDPEPPVPPALVGDWNGPGGGNGRDETNESAAGPFSFTVDTSWGTSIFNLGEA